ESTREARQPQPQLEAGADARARLRGASGCGGVRHGPEGEKPVEDKDIASRKRHAPKVFARFDRRLRPSDDSSARPASRKSCRTRRVFTYVEPQIGPCAACISDS